MTAKQLINIVLTLAVIIPLLIFTVGLSGLFISKENAMTGTDFQRIIGEVDELIAKDYDGDETIFVPVMRDSNLIVYSFPKSKSPSKSPSESLLESPKVCRGQACICLYQWENQGFKIRDCRVYEGVKENCPKNKCGEVCFSKVKKVVVTETTVKITRTCNEITIG